MKDARSTGGMEGCACEVGRVARRRDVPPVVCKTGREELNIKLEKDQRKDKRNEIGIETTLVGKIVV